MRCLAAHDDERDGARGGDEFVDSCFVQKFLYANRLGRVKCP